jgi:hypothetical protein
MFTLSRFAHTLRHELFSDFASDTPGTRLYFRGVELFILAYTVYFCWTWGLSSARSCSP